MLELQRVSKEYAEGPALRAIDFRVAAGERVALLGRNGAGKTTALQLMAGVLEPTEGSVSIEGRELGADPGWRASVGYLPDRPPLYDDMRVRPYLEYVARLFGGGPAEARAATDRVIEQCHLGERANQRIAELSHGHRQRVGLAQALVHQPALLLLDEPAAGLDPFQTARLRDLLHSLPSSMTVVLSSHLLGEVARLCDRFLVLEGGELVRDFQREKEAAPRVRIRIARAPDASEPGAVLEAALGPDALVEDVGPDGFLVDAELRSAASRALIEAGHELVALEDASDALAVLEAHFAPAATADSGAEGSASEGSR